MMTLSSCGQGINECGAGTAHNIRVLMVEDNAGDANLVRLLLQESARPCYSLTIATNFSSALALATRGDWDVILLDLSLPDGLGVKSVEGLALAVPRIPVVVLTGLDDEATAMQALHHGAQDYLVKGQVEASDISRALRHSIARKRFESRLAERAHFDALTGLVNRALFEDRLNHALARASRTGKRVAVLFIDLDDFKAINDSRGHDAGDRVLTEVAKLLCAVARRGDTVARLGGDEFTIVLEDIDDPGHAVEAAKRIHRAFQSPREIGPADWMCISCSFGLAVFPDAADNAGALLRKADAAMFRAKRAGGNAVEHFLSFEAAVARSEI